MNVDYTVIKSPVDGVVVNRLVDNGQTVQASLNTPQFFTIATDLRELKLSAGVDESEIGKVEAGQRVLFNVDAYPARTSKASSTRSASTRRTRTTSSPTRCGSRCRTRSSS